jgi:hypothetical protein
VKEHRKEVSKAFPLTGADSRFYRLESSDVDQYYHILFLGHQTRSNGVQEQSMAVRNLAYEKSRLNGTDGWSHRQHENLAGLHRDDASSPLDHKEDQ